VFLLMWKTVINGPFSTMSRTLCVPTFVDQSLTPKGTFFDIDWLLENSEKS